MLIWLKNQGKVRYRTFQLRSRQHRQPVICSETSGAAEAPPLQSASAPLRRKTQTTLHGGRAGKENDPPAAKANAKKPRRTAAKKPEVGQKTLQVQKRCSVDKGHPALEADANGAKPTVLPPVAPPLELDTQRLANPDVEPHHGKRESSSSPLAGYLLKPPAQPALQPHVGGVSTSTPCRRQSNAADALVERFDIEPFSNFSAK